MCVMRIPLCTVCITVCIYTCTVSTVCTVQFIALQALPYPDLQDPHSVVQLAASIIWGFFFAKVCALLFFFVYLFVCVCLHMCVRVCLCVCAHVCACLSVYAVWYVCMYVCLLLCVYVCT